MKVVVFTGSRAEFGLLRPLIERLRSDYNFDLKLVVSGSHLSPQHGSTVEEIANYGLEVDESVEILLSSDSRIGVAKAMGLGMISFSEVLDRVKPDLVIGLGDRFELFSFVSSAFILGIPIAHIHGGEVTEGAYDDGLRHAITKMSNLHFTSTEDYRRRVVQLGENPDTVFNVGALGLDNIRSMNLMDRSSLAAELGFDLSRPYAVVTYHPETNSEVPPEDSIEILLNALDSFPKLNLVFTKGNADHGGSKINSLIEDYVRNNFVRARLFPSLGSLRYLSVLKYSQMMVGNSSSGIIEMPFFGKPTVNIGERQRGRVFSGSVIQVANSVDSINAGVLRAMNADFLRICETLPNHYGDGVTSIKILEILKRISLKNSNPKKFYDLPKFLENT